MIGDRATKWLLIMVTSSTGKTCRYEVRNAENGCVLGTVKWHGAWRKYAFFPENDTLFETTCLRDICEFLDDLKKDRAESKVKQ